METLLAPVSHSKTDAQQQVWDQLARSREKWHDFMMAFLKPMGEEMIRALHLREEDVVLDLATGTGEPGLTIAGLVPKGSVMGADLSPDMLEIARRKASEKGAANYQTVACEAGHLPFADNTFDAISCRNGYMFFPDLSRSTQELYRVAKPGARIAVSVWGTPEKNPWAALPLGLIRMETDPSPDSTGVSLFRCAESEFIADLFRAAGMKEVIQKRVVGRVGYPSKEAYWQFITEVTAPVALAISRLDQTTQLKVRHALFNLIGEMRLSGNAVFDYEALVIYGIK